MADEASVILRAVDEVSGPAAEAAAALEQYGQTAQQAGAAAAAAAGGVGGLGEAAGGSVVPHRAAHQALSLVSMQMSQMAGASAGAHGAITVLDSILFQIAMTGGAVSLAFIGVTTAIVALTSVFSAMHAESAKTEATLDSLVTKQTALAASSNSLTAAQKSVAAEGAANMQRELMKTADAIGQQEAKLKELMTVEQGHVATLSEQERGIVSTETAYRGSAGEIEKARGALAALKAQQEEQQGQFHKLTEASAGFDAKMREIKNPIEAVAASQHRMFTEGIAGLEREAKAAEGVGKALGNVNVPMSQVIALAQKMQISYVQAATIISGRVTDGFKAMAEAAANSVETLASAAVDSANGVSDAWTKAADSIIKDITRMAIEWVKKHIIMIEVENLLQNVTTAGIFGLMKGIAEIGVIEALGAVMESALSKPAAGAAGLSPSGGGGASGGAAAGTGGVGGTISSAQQTVTNYNTINLPVHALDLASVSDMTMRNLANRIGQLLRDANATGQFALQ